ncbi:hypothetical protein KIPB_007684 [Kipferlia bialata]|uniref:Uncharacterized protein n=1 Tax=Kipferlia bialata TaxID=797122 RepID=A0A391NMP5_9EUKA|nr:hypothetical protein KIPB_007684 [Kipferlia bialata]|eukprot:g7684.t1
MSLHRTSRPFVGVYETSNKGRFPMLTHCDTPETSDLLKNITSHVAAGSLDMVVITPTQGDISYNDTEFVTKLASVRRANVALLMDPYEYAPVPDSRLDQSTLGEDDSVMQTSEETARRQGGGDDSGIYNVSILYDGSI